jgi:hypothetical protein
MITAFLESSSVDDVSRPPPSPSETSSVSLATNNLSFHFTASWPESVWRRYQGDRIIHRRLIHSADSSLDPSLLMYIRADGSKATSDSSTDAAPRAPAGYYREIENHLQQLEKDDGDHVPVERGAIGTAIRVLNELERHNYAPPMVTSSGPEAVVMLWALGGTTYAITITDGELGYVVRRDKKRIKLVDSINIEKFKLLEFK